MEPMTNKQQQYLQSLLEQATRYMASDTEKWLVGLIEVPTDKETASALISWLKNRFHMTTDNERLNPPAFLGDKLLAVYATMNELIEQGRVFESEDELLVVLKAAIEPTPTPDSEPEPEVIREHPAPVLYTYADIDSTATATATADPAAFVAVETTEEHPKARMTRTLRPATPGEIAGYFGKTLMLDLYFEASRADALRIEALPSDKRHYYADFMAPPEPDGLGDILGKKPVVQTRYFLAMSRAFTNVLPPIQAVTTAPETVERYGLSESTVRVALNRDSNLHCRKAGETWLIDSADAHLRWHKRG